MTQFYDVLQANPWFFYGLAFLFSCLIGSFLNVVIHRLPIMMKREWHQDCVDFLKQEKEKELSSKQWLTLAAPIDQYPQPYNLIKPNSTCPKCGTAIKPWQNLPIIGWLALKGRCGACDLSISKRYPWVEFLTGLLVLAQALYFGPSWQFVFSAILTYCLIALTYIDLDHMLLPDQITLPLLWLGLLINTQGMFTDLNSALFGAAAGYLSLWSVFWGFKLLTGKEGMGYGDFKLMAVFGAWLGWQYLPMIILLSSLVGAVVGIFLIVTKKQNSQKPIPFGPYIAVAGWIAMLYGPMILSWYINSFIR